MLEVLHVFFRAVHLSVLFTPLLLSAPLLLVLGVSREHWMELLYETLRLSGPAFIKWGQARRCPLHSHRSMPLACARLAR